MNTNVKRSIWSTVAVFLLLLAVFTLLNKLSSAKEENTVLRNELNEWKTQTADALEKNGITWTASPSDWVYGIKPSNLTNLWPHSSSHSAWTTIATNSSYEVTICPNPNHLFISLRTRIIDGNLFYFNRSFLGLDRDEPKLARVLAGKFFELNGVESVTFSQYEIHLEKADMFKWDELKVKIEAILSDPSSGLVVTNEKG